MTIEIDIVIVTVLAIKTNMAIVTILAIETNMARNIIGASIIDK